MVKKGELVEYEVFGGTRIGVALENENRNRALKVYDERGKTVYVLTHKIVGEAFVCAFDLPECLERKWNELNPDDGEYY